MKRHTIMSELASSIEDPLPTSPTAEVIKLFPEQELNDIVSEGEIALRGLSSFVGHKLRGLYQSWHSNAGVSVEVTRARQRAIMHRDQLR